MSSQVPSRALVLVAALWLLAGCDGRPPEAAAPTAAARTRTQWHVLGSWSGHGDRQTESFDITTGAVRLTWEALDRRASGGGRFRLALHSAISGRILETIVEAEGAGSGVEHVAADPRVAYLQIESDQVDWTVTLEEGVAGRIGTRSESR